MGELMIQTSWTFCLTTLIHPRFVGRLYSFAFYCADFIGLIIISHFRFLVLWPLAINEICSLIEITVWYTCRYLHWKVLSIAYVVKRFAKQIILNGNKKEGIFLNDKMTTAHLVRTRISRPSSERHDACAEVPQSVSRETLLRSAAAEFEPFFRR